MTEAEEIEAWARYAAAFGRDPPLVFGADPIEWLEVVLAAITARVPIPDEYDWYRNLPPGALA